MQDGEILFATGDRRRLTITYWVTVNGCEAELIVRDAVPIAAHDRYSAAREVIRAAGRELVGVTAALAVAAE